MGYSFHRTNVSKKVRRKNGKADKNKTRCGGTSGFGLGNG